MEKRSIILYSLFVYTANIVAAEGAKTNPFDAAITQIDTQSKELNAQVACTQQDGLAQQKAQRLELELQKVTADHAQEIASLKSAYENQIATAKKELATAQQSQSSHAAKLKKLQKELDDARAKITECQNTIAELKTSMAAPHTQPELAQEPKTESASETEAPTQIKEMKPVITEIPEPSKKNNTTLPTANL